MFESCDTHPTHRPTSVLSLFIYQIQDARNHVTQALQLLSSHDDSYHFKTGAEVNKVCPLSARDSHTLLQPAHSWTWRRSLYCVSDTGFMFLLLLQLMDAVMLQLTRARNRLTTPASMTLPELATSGLMVQDTRQSTLHKHSFDTIRISVWVPVDWGSNDSDQIC